MTYKELKKLKRPELLELMYYMREEMDALMLENTKIKERINYTLEKNKINIIPVPVEIPVCQDVAESEVEIPVESAEPKNECDKSVYTLPNDKKYMHNGKYVKSKITKLEVKPEKSHSKYTKKFNVLGAGIAVITGISLFLKHERGKK